MKDEPQGKEPKRATLGAGAETSVSLISRVGTMLLSFNLPGSILNKWGSTEYFGMSWTDIERARVLESENLYPVFAVSY